MVLVHKPFMVIGKIVDLLLEEMFHRAGADLYERGGNIVLANLIYFATPTLCGREDFRRLQESFVRMIRTKSGEDVEGFYTAVDRLSRNCNNRDYYGILTNLAATKCIVHSVLQEVTVTSLDPAVPAFFRLCQAWEHQLQSSFDILHDQSKAVAFDKSLLESYMDPLAAEQEVFGTDRRRVTLPFRAPGIKFVHSADVPQIQIADLVASSHAFWFKNRQNEREREFIASLEQTTLDSERMGWLIGGVWPMPEVDPEGLGTEGSGGENVVNGMARYLANSADRKNKPSEIR